MQSVATAIGALQLAASLQIHVSPALALGAGSLLVAMNFYVEMPAKDKKTGISSGHAVGSQHIKQLVPVLTIKGRV